MLRVRVPPEPSVTPSWSSLECSPPCHGGGGGFDSRTDHWTTRRVAELVDARASEARAPEAWEFESPPGDSTLFQAGRCPVGPHKPGVPGSIPGPGTCGWAGARPSFIRSEAE